MSGFAAGSSVGVDSVGVEGDSFCSDLLSETCEEVLYLVPFVAVSLGSGAFAPVNGALFFRTAMKKPPVSCK